MQETFRGTQLVESEPSQAPVHLSNVADDRAESRNLADDDPVLVAELTAAAEAWRGQIAQRGQTQWLPCLNGETT